MTILLLIRHGQNDFLSKKLAGRLPGVHLNETGWGQAQRLAAELASLKIKKVYASPLERAQETAAPIARVQGLEIESLPALIEIDFGRWEGKTLKHLKRGRLWKNVQDAPENFRFPGGESFKEAQNRIVAGLLSVAEQNHQDDLVVCVSHSDVIRLAVAKFLDMPLDAFQRLRIAPASVSVLNLQGDTPFLGTINQTLGPFQL